MFDIANATDEQTDRWEQDFYTETKWKRLIETRNLEGYAFDANRYPAGASDAAAAAATTNIAQARIHLPPSRSSISAN